MSVSAHVTYTRAVLPPWWIPSYHHCGFRPTTMVDSVLPPWWIPSYHHGGFRPTTMVDSVLPPWWIPSYHHGGFRPTTMVDSVSHNDTAITNTVDLLHAVWSITFTSMCVRQHLAGESRTHLRRNTSYTWHMSISPSDVITADVHLGGANSKRYVALVFEGKVLTPSAVTGW